MDNHVKISVGSVSGMGRIEAEFDAPDDVVEVLEQIIQHVLTFRGEYRTHH